MTKEVEKVKDDRNIIFVGIILVLVSIILMLTVYIVYDKVYSKDVPAPVNNNTVVDNENEVAVEELDKNGRFVKILYDCVSFDELFLFNHKAIDDNYSFKISLNEMDDRDIYRLLLSRVNGIVVAEDGDGKVIHYKEKDLRDAIQYIFGDSKAESFDFESIIKKSGVSNYGENYVIEVDKENGIIIAKQAPSGGAVVHTSFEPTLEKAVKDTQTGDVYLYENAIERLSSGEISGIYNAKLIYGEENGVYYFRGVELQREL